MSDVIKKNFSDHLDVINKVLASDAGSIESIGKLLANCLEKKGTIFWCGNGGSASDSQHIAAELVGRFKKDRPALRSIALTTDTSILTSVGNDYGFDQIFSRQLQALGSPEDILIGISTSGNSRNILNAFKVASDLGITSIALTGKDGGIANKISDYSIIVNSESTARIQEAHILIGHILCEIIEEQLQFV
jgi:D-sedoheptulose 7-phosphate isomerase